MHFCFLSESKYLYWQRELKIVLIISLMFTNYQTEALTI